MKWLDGYIRIITPIYSIKRFFPAGLSDLRIAANISTEYSNSWFTSTKINKLTKLSGKSTDAFAPSIGGEVFEA